MSYKEEKRANTPNGSVSRPENRANDEEPVPVPYDVVCFANDWEADPLSKKQIMLKLARRHRVLWINSINNRKPRVAQKDISRALQKVKGFLRGLVRVQERIWVLSPIYLPFHGSSLVRSFNRWFLGWQIRMALRWLGFARPVTWTFVPTSADVVGTLGEQSIIYHCVDEYSAFSDADPAVAHREQELLQKADVVLVCSDDLWTTKSKVNSNTHVVTHGVDYDHFHSAAEESMPLAAELKDLPRPVIGFHGLIADWVDLPLIAEVARLRPEWSIVLVGKGDTDLSPVSGVPNVHLVGHRPYQRLPEYLRGFDVAILPFVMNELTRNSNPLKLREYLAAGLPVVSAPLPEAVKYAPLVKVAATPGEYVQQIAAILEAGEAGVSQERGGSMARESWDSKVMEIEKVIAKTLANSGHVTGGAGRADRGPSRAPEPDLLRGGGGTL